MRPSRRMDSSFQISRSTEEGQAFHGVSAVTSLPARVESGDAELLAVLDAIGNHDVVLLRAEDFHGACGDGVAVTDDHDAVAFREGAAGDADEIVERAAADVGLHELARAASTLAAEALRSGLADWASSTNETRALPPMLRTHRWSIPALASRVADQLPASCPASPLRDAGDFRAHPPRSRIANERMTGTFMPRKIESRCR